LDCESVKDSAVSERLRTAIADMQASRGLLQSEDLDPRLLTEFRDVLNRVRNVAWAAQQSVANRLAGEDPTAVGSLLAAERIRAAYQLCRQIHEDLGNNEIDFQKGQLAELHTVASELTKQLKDKL
jgi:hypothetical protein